MKNWTSRLGLCLIVAKLSAQSAYPEDAVALAAQRRWSLIILEGSLDPINGSMVPARPRAYERSVVSVQHLQHRIDKNARKLSEKGMRDFFRNRVNEALPLLQHAVALDPHSSVLQNDLGVVYCVLGRDKEAQECFERAIKEDSGSAVTYTNLAAVAFNTYQYKLAETSARQALRFSPLSPEAKVTLGLAEVAQDHWTMEARRMLEENRADFESAKLVLKNWPSSDYALPGSGLRVRVNGAGRSAFAGLPPERIRSRLLSPDH